MQQHETAIVGPSPLHSAAGYDSGQDLHGVSHDQRHSHAFATVATDQEVLGTQQQWQPKD